MSAGQTPINEPQGYVPEPVNNIQRIVLNVIESMRDYGITTARYAWLENEAVRFYRNKLRGYNMPSLVSVNVNVDYATRLWAFPSDYIQYTRVAYNSNGFLVTLGRNDNINLSNGPAVCATPINQLTTPPVSGFWLAPLWGTSLPLYSSGGGFAANYYRVNEADGYIQFSETLTPGRAVVEYLSTGRGINGYTLVPVVYEYAFDKYLKWQLCLLSKDLVKLSPAFEQDYRDSLWDANIIKKAPTTREMMDVIYQTCGFKLR